MISLCLYGPIADHWQVEAMPDLGTAREEHDQDRTSREGEDAGMVGRLNEEFWQARGKKNE